MPPKAKDRRLRRLTKLRLSRVDLVPAGANPGARIELYKRDESDNQEEPMRNDEAAELLKTARELREAATALRKAALAGEPEPGPEPSSADRSLPLEKRRELYIAERQAEHAERFPPRADPAGEFLKRKREELGLTQETVAKAANISQPTLSGIENGSRPLYDTFYEVCKSLGVTYDELKAAGIFRT